VAIEMAITLFEESEYVNVHFFTDKEAAIQANESPECQRRQYIIEGILDKIDRISKGPHHFNP